MTIQQMYLTTAKQHKYFVRNDNNTYLHAEYKRWLCQSLVHGSANFDIECKEHHTDCNAFRASNLHQTWQAVSVWHWMQAEYQYLHFSHAWFAKWLVRWGLDWAYDRNCNQAVVMRSLSVILADWAAFKHHCGHCEERTTPVEAYSPFFRSKVTTATPTWIEDSMNLRWI